jgi:hypothetical protein
MNRNRVLAAIRRPESAAAAGLVFAAILGAALALLHGAAPDSIANAETWVTDPGRRSAISTTLTLLPFAGIALLWFIAVVRTQLGAPDDRFFEIVFVGSGLVFVATLFTAAAALKAVLALDAAGAPASLETAAFAWALASSVLGVFGAKMAAVFTFAVATAGRRAGRLPGWLAVLGYLTGLSLLVIPPLPTAVQFLFPLWVAAVSLSILVRRSAPRVSGG